MNVGLKPDLQVSYDRRRGLVGRPLQRILRPRHSRIPAQQASARLFIFSSYSFDIFSNADFRAVYTKAKTNDERKAAMEKQPKPADHLPGFVELAEASAGSETAAKAWVMVVKLGAQSEDTEALGALHVAKTVRAEVLRREVPHANNSTGPHVSVSIGVAVVRPVHSTTADPLLAAADAALYQAKSRGRNQVVCADAAADGTPEAMSADRAGAALQFQA